MTGRRLLKDELGESAVSKRVVGLDRLVRSEASRDFALPEEMEACPRTGKRVLPAELETCCITHARVLRTELERSDLSGHRALRDHGVRLSDSRWALADETVKCVWLDEQIPKSEAGRCALTGQTFSKKLLNDLGQLASLADLLDGISGHRHPDPNLASRLRQVDPDLAGLTAVDMIRSPGRVRAICGEVHTKGWFRTKVRYVGLLIRSTPKAISVIGHGVMGYRDERGEFVIEEKDLVFGEA